MRQRACHRCATPLPEGKRYCPGCSPTPRTRGDAGQRIRAAALMRAGNRCQIEGCDRRIGLEVHHITPLAQGGTDHPANLVVLCDEHHATARPRGAL